MRGHFPYFGQFESRLTPRPGGRVELQKCPCTAAGGKVQQWWGTGGQHLLKVSTCRRSDRPTSLQEIPTLFIRYVYAGISGERVVMWLGRGRARRVMCAKHVLWKTVKSLKAIDYIPPAMCINLKIGAMTPNKIQINNTINIKLLGVKGQHPESKKTTRRKEENTRGHGLLRI